MTSALTTLERPHHAPAAVPGPRLPRPRLVAVPDCEPPLDAPSVLSVTSRLARRRTWDTLTVTVVDWTVPGWSHDPDVGVLSTPSAALPSAQQTGRLLARTLIETMAGYRSAGQLATVCSPEVHGALRGRIRFGGAAPTLKSVRVSEPADGVAEVCAVYRSGNHCHALAFRLQGVDGRWRITALQVG